MDRRTTLAGAFILSVGAIGLLVSLQGWRSRVPDDDVVAAIVRATALVEHGQIPRRGTLTDLRSYFPPGTAWLAAPGALMFSDPRLVELLGSGALYVGTIAGVFLIGRRYFGVRVAILATVLYGLSAIPLNLATILWPRGHPFFYVWIVYLAGKWVDRRDGRYLAAALIVWAAGMYVHLELAPAFFILPAVWWFYEPPVSWRALAAASLLILGLWAPYLAFQRERGFIDLQSQLLMRPLEIEPRDIEAVAGCDQDPVPAARLLSEKEAAAESGIGPSGPVRWLRIRLPAIADLVLVNLETRVLAGDFLLLSLLVGGLVTASAFVTGTRRRLSSGFATGSWIVPAAALFACSLLATEFALRWVALPGSSLALLLLKARRVHVWVLLLAGVILATDPRLLPVVSRLRDSWRRGADSRLLSIALLVPWAILLLLTEPDRADRMFGIWPLQVTLIAAFVSACSERPPISTLRRWVFPLLVAALIVANPVVLGRARGWLRDGWPGRQTDQLETIGDMLARCESTGARP